LQGNSVANKAKTSSFKEGQDYSLLPDFSDSEKEPPRLLLGKGSVPKLVNFLGLAIYYKRFAKTLPQLICPLHKHTDKPAKYLWTDDCSEAFDKLKRALQGFILF